MAVIAPSLEHTGLCPAGWLAGPAHHVMKQSGCAVRSHVGVETCRTPEHRCNDINPKD